MGARIHTFIYMPTSVRIDDQKGVRLELQNGHSIGALIVRLLASRRARPLTSRSAPINIQEGAPTSTPTSAPINVPINAPINMRTRAH